MKRKDGGFALLEIILAVAVVCLLGYTAWTYFGRQASLKSSNDQVASQATPKTTATPQPTSTADPNQGYLVVKEWGLRFKIPAGLTDVRYLIKNDQVVFYAKPTGSNVEYRSDYQKFDGDTPEHAIGVLYRSTDASKDVMGDNRAGKKVGNYYYYTAWAFSSLATGRSSVGLYFTADCIQNSSSAKCDALMESEGNAAKLTDTMLNSIEIAS